MEYRRVESHDGAVVRVQEYRRHASSPAGSDQTSGGRNFAAETEGSPMKAANRSNEHRKRPRQGAVEADCRPRQSDSRHVIEMVSPRPRSHAKPVIHQHSPDVAKSMTQAQLKEMELAQANIPSPPPTPRPGRLATPDIPELDETPFCDCCDGSNQFKYCTSCGCGIERHML